MPVQETGSHIDLDALRPDMERLLPPGVLPKTRIDILPDESAIESQAANVMGQMIDTLLTARKKGKFREIPKEHQTGTERVILVDQERNLYDRGTLDPGLENLNFIFPRLNTWNRTLNAKGQEEATYFAQEKYEKVRNFVIEAIRQSGSVLIIPFAGEKTSVRANAEYGLSIFGDPKKVILVDAGYDQEATEEAKASKATVIEQQKILQESVDWDTMASLYGLPFSKDNLPTGKGMTLLVGYLYLAAKSQVRPETHVFHHDSDILYPNPYKLPPNETQGYDNLISLGLPIAFPDPNNPADYILGGKQWRDNEVWKQEANRLKRSSIHLKAALGYILGSLIQPVSDARAGIWGDGQRIGVANIPWVNSMGIETSYDIGMAGASFAAGKKLIAQPGIAGSKKENAPSHMPREYTVANHTADFENAYVEHIRTIFTERLAIRTDDLQLPYPFNNEVDTLALLAKKYPKLGEIPLIRIIADIYEDLPPDKQGIINHVIQEAELAALPHNWGPVEIESFNRAHGGEGYHHDLPGPTAGSVNVQAIITQEWMFPSVQEMIDRGLVDLDKIRTLYL